eukprot:SAG31_NODE_3299_length_4445_cov_3.190520_5_plen_174_part_00
MPLPSPYAPKGSLWTGGPAAAQVEIERRSAELCAVEGKKAEIAELQRRQRRLAEAKRARETANVSPQRRRRGELDAAAKAATEAAIANIAAESVRSATPALTEKTGVGQDASARRLLEIRENELAEERQRFRNEELKMMKLGVKEREREVGSHIRIGPHHIPARAIRTVSEGW